MSEIVYAGLLKIDKLILFYHDNHYDTFKSLPTFFSNSYFCFSCFKTNEHFENHPCNVVCKKCRCREWYVISFEKKMKCEFCLVNCNSHLCYLNHRDKVCSKIDKCIACGAFNIFSNICQGKWCMFCRKYVDLETKCFILTMEKECRKII